MARHLKHAAAQDNAIGGIPTLTLPFLVITKLISSRTQDTADLSRVLGAAGVRDCTIDARPHHRCDGHRELGADLATSNTRHVPMFAGLLRPPYET